MIYIFNVFSFIFSLPSMCCTECGKLCAQLNCNMCRDGCRALSRWFSELMAKPLSTYVILAFLISGFEIYLCYSAFNNTACELDTKSASVDFAAWVLVQGAFATLNLVFAPYFQCRIWQRLKEELNSNETLYADEEGYVTVPKSDVQDAFKHTFLYDFGVLIYFFAAVASFIWSWMGLKWMALAEQCRLELIGSGGWAAYCGNTLCGVALLYLFAWYCCGCCAKQMKVQKSAGDDFKAGGNNEESDMEGREGGRY